MPTIQTNCWLPAFLGLITAASSQAQSNVVDTTRSLHATRAAIFYQSYIGPDAAIYNGPAYQPNYVGLQGSPYFETDNLTDGSITCENITYNHIQLLYNLVLDQPVIADPKGQLLLPPLENIQRFTFANHTFLHINTGFYEFLRSGPVSLLVRHTKKIEERIDGNQLVRFITSREEYYTYKNNQLNLVSSGDGPRALRKALEYYNKSPH